MTIPRRQDGKPCSSLGATIRRTSGCRSSSAARSHRGRRWLWTALLLTSLAAPSLALAQTTPVPTDGPVAPQTDPFAQSVTVGGQTYGTDALCPLAAVLIARQTILNAATVDTLQPIFRTNYGFVAGISFQTADVGLENVKVGQSVCIGKAAS